MLGIDIIKVSRIEDLKAHDQFYRKVFTENEIAYIYKMNQSNQSIAGILAAKEAVSKVFKTGIGKQLAFHDIEILHQDRIPYLNIKKERIAELMAGSGYVNIAISISHEKEYAVAVAMAEKD